MYLRRLVPFNLAMNARKMFPKYFGISLIVLIVIFIAVELSLYEPLLASLIKGRPLLFEAYLSRSLFFVIASAVTVALIHQDAVRKKYNQRLLWLKQPHWSKGQQITAWVTLFAVFLSVGLLYYNPALFSYLCREDVFIEPLSALFFFASSAILISQVPKVHRQKLVNYRFIIAGLGLLAAIFFVIAMEEISWFQRVAEFETPDAFSLNQQGEFNLHNFATDLSEYVFYTGTFLYLIVLPFLHLASVLPKRLKGLENFIGGGFTLCISSVFVAYNYNMWNAFPIQVAYFLTMFVLLSLCLLSYQTQMKKTFMMFIVTLLVTQAVFLGLGHTMPRLWDATEYKEGFIAFSFFLYALNVRSNLSLYER